MELIHPSKIKHAVPSDLTETVTEADTDYFFQTIDTSLTPEQESRITRPEAAFPRQENVLAVHWHPEFVPMELIEKRYTAMFPNCKKELVIPTQHNIITSWNGYSGVEVDCYSRGFNQKVQLLLHFENTRLDKADVLKTMLAHTFKYRSSQLFDFMHTFTRPEEDRLQEAARETGTAEDMVEFVRTYVKKIEAMLEEHWETIPADAIKNKLLRNYFDLLREEYDNAVINRAQAFLKAVKKLVKADFSLSYFYRTSEVIEEARAMGAGIVIPHPEQFWPILLADYDVDGFEVWNPQSQKYTEFLVTVLNKKNKSLRHSERRLLIFMGDDTHMGEKVKDPSRQDKEKASREIGLQPAWDDMSIRKQLIVAGTDRKTVIEEYAARLRG